MPKLNTGEVKTKIVELLKRYPQGVSAAHLAIHVERSRDRVLSLLAELQDTGRVIGVMLYGPPRRKVWFHLDFADRAPAQAKKHDILMPWKKRKQAEKTVTIAPKPLDRFAVEKPEPFFSRPEYRTTFIESGSAVERAYK